MKACFSWLKKNAENADRLSSAASACLCVLLFTGTVVLFAKRIPTEEVAEMIPAPPTRIAIKFQDALPSTPPAEQENTPEETPPATNIPERNNFPPDEPRLEKIDESAIRETEETQPETPAPLPPKPTPTEHSPEKEHPPQETAPPQIESPRDPGKPEISQNEAARCAAEQTLYGALLSAIRRKKFYPKVARRAGHTGTVYLKIEISADGKISDVALASSSAHKNLEAGAMKTLLRVTEEFSAPAETSAVLPATFVVPVVYELR